MSIGYILLGTVVALTLAVASLCCNLAGLRNLQEICLVTAATIFCVLAWMTVGALNWVFMAMSLAFAFPAWHIVFPPSPKK